MYIYSNFEIFLDRTKRIKAKFLKQRRNIFYSSLTLKTQILTT